MAEAARTSGRWLRRLVRPSSARGSQGAQDHLLAALDLDHVRGCLVAPSVNDVYVVGEELGEGRTAVVHEGTDKRAVGSKSTWGRCALKLFRVQDMREEDEAAEMIRGEVAVLLALPRHPAVVQLLQVVSTPDVVVLSLELVAGGDLFSMIEDTGPCPEGRARTLFLQILDGLEHLHAHGIAHRDLKPENICFVDDSRRALKLIDLGAAAFITPAGFTDLAGTPIYAAPEICPWFFQEEGSEPPNAFDTRASMSWDSLEEEDGLDPSPLSFGGVGFPGPPTGALQPAPRPPSPGDTLPAPYGEAVDFWAAGVLLYVILSGESPFSQEKDVEDVLTDIAAMRPRGVAMESDVWGSISDAAKDLVHCLMEPSPERRYNGARVREHIWLAPFAIAAAPPIPARGPPGLPRPSPHAMPAGLGRLSPAANGTGASAAGHCAPPTPANHNDPELSLALSYLPHALAPSHRGLQGDLRLLLVPEATTVGRVIAMTIQFTPRGVIVLPGRAEEPPSALAATTRGALMRWLGGEAAFTHAARPPAASLAPRFIAAFAPDRRSYRAHLAAAAARERTPGGRMLAASPAGLYGGRDDGKLVRTPGPFIGRVLSFGMRRSKSAGQLATEELPQHLHRRSSPEVLSPRPSGGRQQL